jgi:hypothetical protein
VIGEERSCVDSGGHSDDQCDISCNRAQVGDGGNANCESVDSGGNSDTIVRQKIGRMLWWLATEATVKIQGEKAMMCEGWIGDGRK